MKRIENDRLVSIMRQYKALMLVPGILTSNILEMNFRSR